MTIEDLSPAAEAAPDIAQQEVADVTTPQNDDIDRSKEPTPKNSLDRAFEKAGITEDDFEHEDPKPKKESADKSTKEPVSDADGEKPDEAAKAKANDKTADKTVDKDVDKPSDKKSDDEELAAPSRFKAEAKAAWKDVPAPVKTEIERAVKELEGGIASYQERFEKIEPFEKLAKEHNLDLAEQMDSYVKIDQLLHKDFLGGLSEICKNRGVSLRDVAAQIAGQPQSYQASQQDATIRNLQTQIETLTNQLGGVTSKMQGEKEAQTIQEVDAFAAENPRFDELSEDIVFFIESGKASDMQTAYDLAARLNPETPEQQANAAQTREQDDENKAAQTRKANLSLSGSPASGSNPKTKKKSASTRAAIDDAFDKLGIR